MRPGAPSTAGAWRLEGMTRRLLNLLTALSLLLCVALVVLWVRRYTVTDRFFVS